MAERSGGDVPTCVRCRNPLPKPDARFCSDCGAPQQQMRQCIACGAKLEAHGRHCIYCGTDQNNPNLCVNRQCRRPLLPGMMLCSYCKALQYPEATHIRNVQESQVDPSHAEHTHPFSHPPPSGMHSPGYPAVMHTPFVRTYQGPPGASQVNAWCGK